VAYQIIKYVLVGVFPDRRTHGGQVFLAAAVGPHCAGAVFGSAPDFGVRVNPPFVKASVEVDVEDESCVGVDFEVVFQERVDLSEVISAFVESSLLEFQRDEPQSGDVGCVALAGLAEVFGPEMHGVYDFTIDLQAGDAIAGDDSAQREIGARLFLRKYCCSAEEDRQQNCDFNLDEMSFHCEDFEKWVRC